MAENKEQKSNVCINNLSLYTKAIKGKPYKMDDKGFAAIKISYGKAVLTIYYLLDEQDGITDLVADLRDVHKKYIGKKGMSYHDFIFSLSAKASDFFPLESFADGYDEKILAIASVVAGDYLHDYRPNYPWGYHTRRLLELLDSALGQHNAVDKFKNSHIHRTIINRLRKMQLSSAIIGMTFFLGGVTLIILGVIGVMKLWLGLLLGIPVTLIAGFFGIASVIGYATNAIGKGYDRNQIEDYEFYHLASRSRIR